MSNMTWLERDDPRWGEAWAGLEAEFGDRTGYNEQSGEAWQYMGSVVQENPGSWPARQFVPEGALRRLVSQFRHRDLGGRRVYWNFWHEGRAS